MSEHSAEKDVRCPIDGQTLAWHQHTEVGPDGNLRTNAEFSGCDWYPAFTEGVEAERARVLHTLLHDIPVTHDGYASIEELEAAISDLPPAVGDES